MTESKETKSHDVAKIAITVSIVTIIVNAVLSGGKLIVGILDSSSAMISDAIHSASDVFSTIIVIIGIKISAKASDKDHPYGHERMECVAAIILAIVLGGTGVAMGYAGIMNIVNREYVQTFPGWPALIAAIISIAVKEGMYWYTRSAAKLIKSDALMADAWHHRSDAFSSVGAFAGILGSMLGAKILDSIASIIICLFVLKVAIDIFRSSIGKMVDRACDRSTEDKMRELILAQDGVMSLDVIKTRIFGNKVYVEIEISVDENAALKKAHTIAENVHDLIEHNFTDVKHCMVHVNPYVMSTDSDAGTSDGNSEGEKVNNNEKE